MVKILTTILLLFLCIELSNAQKNTIDSLDRLIAKNTTDTGRINLVNNKISILSQINIDSAISLGKKILMKQKNKLQKRRSELQGLRLDSISLLLEVNLKQQGQTLRISKSYLHIQKDSTGVPVACIPVMAKNVWNAK